MPIIVKDFIWKQTNDFITITVPLRGIHHSKVDIFYSERYIKANFCQFFFEVLLSHPISVNESKCTFIPTDIIFELCKVEKMMWDTLEPNDLTKEERMKLKLTLIQEEYANTQTNCQKIENKKSELKRTAVSEQIKIEAKIRSDIEMVKKKEQVEALGDLKVWQKDLNVKIDKIKKKKERKFERYLSTRSSEIPLREREHQQLQIPSLIRATKELEIDFTPRQFPTPLRESKMEEENEWLKKQAEARRSVGFVSEDIKPEEKNPTFLLKKGDEFMKNNNYLGALSAYSFGIQLSKQFVDLYIARSKAHFAQGNFHKATLDCSTALELMVPKVEANLKQRAECIGIRGMSLCKLKMLSKGIDEMEESLKLQPNEELKDFLKKAEIEWMNSNED